jgi:hypothetical protein
MSNQGSAATVAFLLDSCRRLRAFEEPTLWTPSSLITVSSIKPTFDLTLDAEPSGGYVRCN